MNSLSNFFRLGGYVTHHVTRTKSQRHRACTCIYTVGGLMAKLYRRTNLWQRSRRTVPSPVIARVGNTRNGSRLCDTVPGRRGVRAKAEVGQLERFQRAV